jgi:hypothetical protein
MLPASRFPEPPPMSFALRSPAIPRLIAAGLTLAGVERLRKGQAQGAGAGEGMPPPEVGVVTLQPAACRW